eukprot:3930329-Pyramimonas_sp.AAC.1
MLITPYPFSNRQNPKPTWKNTPFMGAGAPEWRAGGPEWRAAGPWEWSDVFLALSPVETIEI